MICFGRCFCKFRKKDGKELISEYFCEMKKGWVRIMFFFYRSEAVVQSLFCKKGVLENFANFTGKHLCQSLFFNKVAGLRLATLLK